MYCKLQSKTGIIHFIMMSLIKWINLSYGRHLKKVKVFKMYLWPKSKQTSDFAIASDVYLQSINLKTSVTVLKWMFLNAIEKSLTTWSSRPIHEIFTIQRELYCVSKNSKGQDLKIQVKTFQQAQIQSTTFCNIMRILLIQ